MVTYQRLKTIENFKLSVPKSGHDHFQELLAYKIHSFIHFICHVYNILQSCMINGKEKIKWWGDLKETTGLILGQVSSLKKRNRSIFEKQGKTEIGL